MSLEVNPRRGAIFTIKFGAGIPNEICSVISPHMGRLDSFCRRVHLDAPASPGPSNACLQLPSRGLCRAVRQYLPALERSLAVPPPKRLLDAAGLGLHIVACRQTSLDLSGAGRAPRSA